MPTQYNDTSSETPQEKPQAVDRRANLPSIEDGGVSDSTVASPALGFGMDRADLVNESIPDPESAPAMSTPYESPVNPEPMSGFEYDPVEQEVLKRNEVAAVSVDRAFYVSDVPSPYLTTRQAQEDVEVTRRRRSRISAIIVTLFLVAGLGTGGYFLYNAIKPTPQAKVESYETREIEYGEYLETIDTTSLVRPANQVVVTADVSGTIAEAYVQNDSDVQEGDQIFRLENPTVTDALDKAWRALETFEQEANKKQEALDKANEAATKAEEEAKKDDKNQAAKVMVEQTKNDVARAQSELDAANNNLWNMQQTYYSALEQANMLNVYAPISGRVSDLTELAEDNGSVSGSSRLCTISDMTHFSIVMEIPRSEERRVKVGQEVRLSFPAIEDLKVTSTVSEIEEDEDKLMATVLIENPDERITTGIAAEASIILKSVPDTYIVPDSALFVEENGSTHLHVLLDPTRGIVTDVVVKVLATDGERAAVDADNIQAGTAVVVSHSEDAAESNT